jgi:hypothetical protein
MVIILGSWGRDSFFIMGVILENLALSLSLKADYFLL